MDYKKESQANFNFLAKELALNYYNGSLNTEDKRNPRFADKILHNKELRKYSQKAHLEGFPPMKDMEITNTSKASGKKAQTRTVLVLGAGATYDSFTSIPLAMNAITRIHEEIIFNIEGFKPINFMDLIEVTDPDNPKIDEGLFKSLQKSSLLDIGNKYHRIKKRLMLYGPEGLANSGQPDFETYLHLLSSFVSSDKVRTLVQKLYDKRHGPIHLYELVAHMLKHRLLDVVINFNFDEFLDQSIDDELGKRNYYSILSDGDCKILNDFLNKNETLKTPIYIKPHGTASHKSTLRFTKDHYYELPPDIHSLIQRLLSSRSPSKSSEEQKISQRINLIVVGFNMESIEFNDMLRRYLPKYSNIFIFNHQTSDEKIEFERQLLRQKLQRIFKSSKISTTSLSNLNVPSIYIINHKLLTEQSFGALGHTFEMLWKKIVNYYRERFEPADIARHKIIQMVFGNSKAWDFFREGLIQNGTVRTNKDNLDGAQLSDSRYPEEYFDSADYFLDRTIVELYISLASGKGIVDPRVILSEKVGVYYGLYSQKVKGGRQVPLEYLLTDIGERVKIHVHHNEMGPSRYREFQSFDANNVWFRNKKYEPFSDESAISAWFSASFRTYLKSLDASCKTELLTMIQIVFKSNKSVIKANFYDPQHHMFQNYKFQDVIHTKLKMQFNILKAIYNQNSKGIFLCVAETGHSFSEFKKEIKETCSSSCIILACPGLLEGMKIKERRQVMTDYIKGLNLDLSDSSSIYLFLPPRRHNNHLLMFLNEETKIMDKSIYYSQRGYSKHINPLLIENRDNNLLLLIQFQKYIENSERYGHQHLNDEQVILFKQIKDSVKRKIAFLEKDKNDQWIERRRKILEG